MRLRNQIKRQEWRQIKRLYKTAFPRYERKPLLLVRIMNRKNKADIWIVEKDNEFTGFAITNNAEDLVLLDYFAIIDDKRGAGLGAEALRLLQEYYAGRRFFLEIESVDIPADNLQQRLRRKQFYLANRMTEMQVKAKVFGVEMELLGYNCQVSFEEYRSVYVLNYGERAAANIQEM